MCTGILRKRGDQEPFRPLAGKHGVGEDNPVTDDYADGENIAVKLA